MTQKHTPTPWKYVPAYKGETQANGILNYPDYIPILEGNGISEANAAFIVRACNSYAALVLALELQEALHMPSSSEKREKTMEVAGYVPNDHYDAEYTFADFVADKRAEALALAKGA